VTLSGLIRSGTLEQVEDGEYLIQAGDGTVKVDHSEVAEIRYYRQLTPEEQGRLRILPIMRLRRANGWETMGWVKEFDNEMYEVGA